MAEHPMRQSTTKSNDEILQETYENLITANHILHKKNVVDAYGHISVRHPLDPSKFIMSASVAPGLVCSVTDLITYHVKDASPVDTNAAKGYQERFIHSEIYKKYDGTNSVVHSHSEEVLPFGIVEGMTLRPVFHIAGFLGHSCPVYKIEEFYDEMADRDMLVNTQPLGSALAAKFSSRFTTTSLPDHSTVVMQNHGFTVVGQSIQQTVFRAVYTHINASLQMKALTLSAAIREGNNAGIAYLDEKQIAGCTAMGERTFERPWGLWVKEVAADPLYKNQLEKLTNTDVSQQSRRSQPVESRSALQQSSAPIQAVKPPGKQMPEPHPLDKFSLAGNKKLGGEPRAIAKEIMALTAFFILFWGALAWFVLRDIGPPAEKAEL